MLFSCSESHQETERSEELTDTSEAKSDSSASKATLPSYVEKVVWSDPLFNTKQGIETFQSINDTLSYVITERSSDNCWENWAYSFIQEKLTDSLQLALNCDHDNMRAEAHFKHFTLDTITQQILRYEIFSKVDDKFIDSNGHVKEPYDFSTLDHISDTVRTYFILSLEGEWVALNK